MYSPYIYIYIYKDEETCKDKYEYFFCVIYI